MAVAAHKYPALAGVPRSRLPQLATAIKRFELRNTPLLDWVPRVSPQFESPAHLAPLVAALERAEREPVRLLVSVPPRHAKTTTILHGVSWLLARNPRMTAGYASYNAALARSKSRECRDIATRAGVQMRDDVQNLGEWRTSHGGGLLAAGVGGTWTGMGVNVLIVDDPLANREEAESQTIRDQRFDWLTSTAMTRVEKFGNTPGSIIVCHTRWHADDMIGRLAHEQPGIWEPVNLPALDGDGAALWPARATAEELQTLRMQIGEYDFASLFLGSPRPRGGHVFAEPTRYTTPAIQGARIFIGVDVAATAKTRSDYSVAVVGAVYGHGAAMSMDVLEVYRAQVELPALVAQLEKMSKRWNAPLLIETNGIGKSVPQFLRQIDGKLRIVEVTSRGDKFLRSQPLASAWNSGRVRVPLDAPWLRPYLTEMLNATLVNDKHDDCPDATANIWLHVAGSTVSSVSLERGPFSHFNKPRVRTDDFGRPIRS